MRLRGWHVEGFGLLHDFLIQGLPDGLTVVFGPNEAGKTSLLSFIRGVLFGFPDRRRKGARQYPPLRGGRHGGRMFVTSDEAEWTVERFASPAHLVVTQPDGTPGSDADLRRLLGGVDAELYGNVFAFSLAELQQFESLQVEGVRDRLFAAGVVGAGRSARSAIDTFAARSSELGKKRGACVINDLRARLTEIDSQLAVARSRALRYPERRAAVETAGAEQQHVGQALTAARVELNRTEVLLAVWPDWDERSQADAELAMLSAGADLPDPDDLATRLDAALLTERTCRDRWEERRREIDELERRLAGITPDERLPEIAAEVKRLVAQSGAARSRRARVLELIPQREALRSRTLEDTARLGTGWTPEQVRVFDTSIPAAQELADWGTKLRAAEDAARRADEEAESAAVAANEAEEELARRVAAVEMDDLPAAETLREQQSAVRKLRFTLVDVTTVRAEIRLAEQSAREAARRAEEARHTVARKDAEIRRKVAALETTESVPDREQLLGREREIEELRRRLYDLEVQRGEARSAAVRFEERRTEGAQRASARPSSSATPRWLWLSAGFALGCLSVFLFATSQSLGAVLALAVGLAILAAGLRSVSPASDDVAIRIREAERVLEAQEASLRAAEKASTELAARLGFQSLPTQLEIDATAREDGARIRVREERDRDVAALAELQDETAELRDLAEKDGQAAQSAEDVLEAARKGGRTAEEAANSIAAILGIPGVPDTAGVESRADELTACVRRRQDHDRNAASLDELRQKGTRLWARARQTEELANRTRSEAEDVRAAWTMWKTTPPVPIIRETAGLGRLV